MSILIKGMEMPKSCGECAIKSWDGEDDVCPFSGISALSIGRQDDCPLVPVPDHGRLIDADNLMKLEVIPSDNWVFRAIEKAPTIIPASFENPTKNARYSQDNPAEEGET